MSSSPRTFARRVRRTIRRERSYFRRISNWVTRVWRFFRARWGFVLWLLIAQGMASAFASTEGGWRLGLLFAALASLLNLSSIATTPYSHESGPYAFLPMSDAEVLRHVAVERWYRNRWWLVALPMWYVIMTLGAAGWPLRAGELIAAGLLGLAHQIVVFALGAIWLAYFARLVWRPLVGQRVGFGILFCLFALVFGSRLLAEPLAPVVEWVLLALPTGWIAGAWLAWLETQTVPPTVYGALAVVVVGWLPLAYARLRESFAIREVEFYGTHIVAAVGMDGQRPWGVPVDPEDELRQEEPPTMTAAEQDQLARWTSPEVVRHVLESVRDEYGGGPLVRMAFGGLDARQRVIAGMLMGINSTMELEWERRYVKSARWLVGLLAVVCFLPDQAMRPWLAFGPVAFVSFFATPALGGVWTGVAGFGQSLGVKTLPIGYREISRVMLRINRVRVLAWLPLALAGCAVAGWKLGIGPEAGLIVGGKAAILVLALQPLTVMMQIHQGTQDGGGFFAALKVATLGVAVIGGGLAAGFMLLQADPKIAMAGAVGVFLAGELVHFFGRRRYELGPIDVDSKPTAQQYWQ